MCEEEKREQIVYHVKDVLLSAGYGYAFSDDRRYAARSRHVIKSPDVRTFYFSSSLCFSSSTSF